MKSTVREMVVPVTVDGHISTHATFTVTATEMLSKVIAKINYEGKLFGECEFATGLGIENVMATVQNLLTPEPPACCL